VVKINGNYKTLVQLPSTISSQETEHDCFVTLEPGVGKRHIIIIITIILFSKMCGMLWKECFIA